MPVFEHISHYRNPRDEVFAWHERPGAFVRLSPPGHLALVSGPTDGTRVGHWGRAVARGRRRPSAPSSSAIAVAKSSAQARARIRQHR